jgi:hypothetical protein
MNNWYPHVTALFVVSVIGEPLVLSIETPAVLILKVPVPIAEELFMLIVPPLSVVVPV